MGAPDRRALFALVDVRLAADPGTDLADGHLWPSTTHCKRLHPCPQVRQSRS